MHCFIIAEAGVNHNGSADMALALVDAAKMAGADAVKFQTFKADELVKAGAAKAPYQEAATGSGDQLAMLRGLEISVELHERLAAHCAALGIEFMSTPFDIESARFLVKLGMRRIKIPSGELTNHPFLKKLAELGPPLILSTGMATLEEVKTAVAVIQSARQRKGDKRPTSEYLSLLHCTSNYPAAFADLNLRAMQTLHAACHVPVGYSDHSVGILIAPLAVALGATIIEKHFTLDRKLPGPDHKASLEPDELAAMVAAIRDTEIALGSAEKMPVASEKVVRDLARRSVTLRRSVAKGHVLGEDDVELLRPGTGIPPADLERVIDKKVKTDLPLGHTLQWSDLQ